MSGTGVPFYGEVQCGHKRKQCSNKAYWVVPPDQYLCGVHSRSKRSRTPLPKNPKRSEEKLQRYKVDADEVEAAAASNRRAGKRGHVICSKLRMMKPPEHNPGYLKVFPNFRAGNRKDGLGLPELSPKSMGPVEHGQPGLPPARNLENFHQGNKVFWCEDEKGYPAADFFATQRAMYEDPIPHRHKTVARGRNVPLYSAWVRPDGHLEMLTYLQSRKLYCTFYERFAKASQSYADLQQKLTDGYNIQIVGYDGYAVDRSLDDHYNDATRPFGHELVLYTLLTVENPEDYPWSKATVPGFH